MKKGFFVCFIIALLLGCNISAQAAGFLEEKDEYIIVIDPGHGGDNWGTTSNTNFLEKEITMKTAVALVDELSKYDGVTVILTHKDDVDLSLKDRAKVAQKADADFLFSIHYNASEYHTMFGTEVWIPLEAPYHALGYQFAYLQQLQMQELGLFSRGIKTRVNDSGTDYYGIIRESVSRDIPAVIIEHCYVDEARDSAYVDSDDDFVEFGKRDAYAIAQFLGLEPYEEALQLQEISINDKIANTYEDRTIPDTCQIEVSHADYENCLLTIEVKASDADTPLMFYDYSIDGGLSYSKLYSWPDSDMLTGSYKDNFLLTLDIPQETTPTVILRAYNKFDIYKESNSLSGFSVFKAVEPSAEATASPFESEEIVDVQASREESNTAISQTNSKRFFLLIVFVLLWIILLALMAYMVYYFFGKGHKQ